MRRYSYVVLVLLICCFLISDERKERFFASLIPKDELAVTTKTVPTTKVEVKEEPSPEQAPVIENCAYVPETILEEEKKEKVKPKIRDCDKRYSDYVEAYFVRSVKKLHDYGFTGPFADEVARYAIARQIIEDGIDREHKVSMVGMVPGGLNKRVVSRLGLELNKTNESGYKLTRVTANDGQGCYAFYGDFSNVLSVVAVTMVWDEYVNGEEGFLRKDELRSAWNKSKELSEILAKDPENYTVRSEYNQLEKLRKDVIERCNSMYGPNGSSVKMIVKNLNDMFEYLLPD